MGAQTKHAVKNLSFQGQGQICPLLLDLQNYVRHTII